MGARSCSSLLFVFPCLELRAKEKSWGGGAKGLKKGEGSKLSSELLQCCKQEGEGRMARTLLKDTGIRLGRPHLHRILRHLEGRAVSTHEGAVSTHEGKKTQTDSFFFSFTKQERFSIESSS